MADPDDGGVGFNCLCDDPQSTSTLAELRSRMMVRLGFAAQKDDPPPGMTDLLNDYLFSAQRFLFRKYPALRTRRLFRWSLETGIRFYGLRTNDEDVNCARVLDPYKTREWVGIEGPNGEWYPLIDGISPTLYTTVTQPGRPTHYEIRECIEVWPPPDEQDPVYKLWVKGHAELLPFAEDEDITTLDSELVFLWALANAQTHYGKADATATSQQAQSTIMSLVAGTHGTKRYIPGETPRAPLPRPSFPFEAG